MYEYENLCKKILKVSQKIRSARVITKNGHSEAGGMREGVKSLESPKHDKMMFMELMLRVKMRMDFDAEFGPVNFSLSHRGRVIFLSFPLRDGHAMLVSCEKDVNIAKIPFEIIEHLDGFKE